MQATSIPRDADRTTTSSGLPAGTPVMTQRGPVAVETLRRGDAVVTRAGLRRLAGVCAAELRGAAMVAIAPGALGHDRPDAPLVLPAALPVLLRGARARLLYGAEAVLVPAGRLADGVHVVPVTLAAVTLVALHFDAPAIAYAAWVEVGCTPLPVAA